MNKIKYFLLLMLTMSIYYSLNTWNIGAPTTSQTTTTLTYTYFIELKNSLNTLLNTTKSKTTISTDESNSYLVLASQIETYYNDLFTKVAKQGSTSKDTEPYSLLSYQIQQQIMAELAEIAPLVQAELNKVVIKTSSITSKTSSLSSKATTFSTRLKEAQDNIAALNDTSQKDATTLLNSVNSTYEKISVWGNFDSITLSSENFLKKLTSEQMKTLFGQKNDALNALKKKLDSITSTDENIKTAKNDLTSSITTLIDTTNKAIENLG